MATNDELQSAKILLEEIKELYYHENERNQILDNKASVGLTLVGVLLTLCITTLPKYNLKEVPINNFEDIISNLLFLILLIAVFLTLITSLYFFYKSLKTKTYKHLNTDGFNDRQAIKEENIIALTLIKLYKTSIDYNRMVNNEKYKDIDKGIKCVVISVFLYIIYMIFYKIII